MAQDQIKLRNAIRESAEKDRTKFEAQANEFHAAYDNADSDTKDKMIADLFDNSYLKQNAIEEIMADINAGGEESRIIKKIFQKGLPVFFLSQTNNAVVPEGLHKLDELIEFETVENGAMRMDYQDFTGVDSLEIYSGSGGTAPGDWVKDFTMFGADEFAMEDYTTLHTVHKGITTFTPLFTNAHKDTILFILQLNDRIKRMGQAIENFMMGVRGKYLWMAADVDLDDSDRTKFVIKPSAAPTPDRTITANTFYEGITMLNTYFMSLTSAVRDHFVKGSGAEALFQVNGLSQQLQRSVSLKDLRLVVSNDFKNKYDMFIKAGAFNMSEASILTSIGDSMRSFAYDLDFGPQFANITGLADSLVADKDNNITGSIDLIVMTPGVIKIINQFNESNEFKVPNETVALNTWLDFGIMINKQEDKFYERVRLTIGGTTPTNATK